MRFPIRLLATSRTIVGTFATTANKQLGFPKTPTLLAPLLRLRWFCSRHPIREATDVFYVRNAIERTNCDAGDVWNRRPPSLLLPELRGDGFTPATAAEWVSVMLKRERNLLLGDVLAILPMFPCTTPLGKYWEKLFPCCCFLSIELDEHRLPVDGG